jgi:hypothetical protein
MAFLSAMPGDRALMRYMGSLEVPGAVEALLEKFCDMVY